MLYFTLARKRVLNKPLIINYYDIGMRLAAMPIFAIVRLLELGYRYSVCDP